MKSLIFLYSCFIWRERVSFLEENAERREKMMKNMIFMLHLARTCEFSIGKRGKTRKMMKIWFFLYSCFIERERVSFL